MSGTNPNTEELLAALLDIDRLATADASPKTRLLEIRNLIAAHVRASAEQAHAAKDSPTLQAALAGPRPICNGIEGCDHTVPERTRALAALPTLQRAAHEVLRQALSSAHYNGFCSTSEYEAALTTILRGAEGSVPSLDDVARIISPGFNPNSTHRATKNTATSALRKARRILELWASQGEAAEMIDCPRCEGSGFSGHGGGYDDVCDECGGQKLISAKRKYGSAYVYLAEDAFNAGGRWTVVFTTPNVVCAKDRQDALAYAREHADYVHEKPPTFDPPFSTDHHEAGGAPGRDAFIAEAREKYEEACRLSAYRAWCVDYAPKLLALFAKPDQQGREQVIGELCEGLGKVVVYQIEEDDRVHLRIGTQVIASVRGVKAMALLKFDADQRAALAKARSAAQ